MNWGGDRQADGDDSCRSKGVNPAEESVRDTASIPSKRAWGGEYAPFILPSAYVKTFADQTVLYFLMSTWNPYQVVLMKTQVNPIP